VFRKSLDGKRGSRTEWKGRMGFHEKQQDATLIWIIKIEKKSTEHKEAQSNDWNDALNLRRKTENRMCKDLNKKRRRIKDLQGLEERVSRSKNFDSLGGGDGASCSMG